MEAKGGTIPTAGYIYYRITSNCTGAYRKQLLIATQFFPFGFKNTSPI